MALTEISTSLQTMAGATATTTLAAIKGKIYSIEIRTSASHTFHIYDLKQDNSTAYVDIYGSSVTPITVASDSIVYPRVQACGTTGSGISGVYDQFYVNGEIKIDVASGSAGHTFNVIVAYEPA